MKSLRYFLPLVLVLKCALFAAEEVPQDKSRFDFELNERDFEALREFLNTKREGSLDDKDDNLNISGDVRFEWRHMSEAGLISSEPEKGKVSFRGSKRMDPLTKRPISKNDFDCEFNLKFDYYLDKTWAVAHLQYDDSAGVDSEEYDCREDCKGWFGSGKCDEICLRKAFMGYNVWLDDCSKFDVELGRRGNLYLAFDSRIQFLSRFDGVLLKYERKKLGYLDKFYARAAAFVVDEKVNHYAYGAEVGFLGINCTGLDLKYSFINWCGQCPGRCVKDKETCPDHSNIYKEACRPYAFDFAISQFTFAYNWEPEFLCFPVNAFGAILVNHRGDKLRHHLETTRKFKDGHVAQAVHFRNKANIGWYLGVGAGEITGHEGDWEVQLQYQVVQALAVPGQDVSGICNGNVFDYTLTRDNIDNTNYRGWKLEGLYALTDNILVDTIIEHSWADDPEIGGSHRYSKVELEAVYAF